MPLTQMEAENMMAILDNTPLDGVYRLAAYIWPFQIENQTYAGECGQWARTGRLSTTGRMNRTDGAPYLFRLSPAIPAIGINNRHVNMQVMGFMVYLNFKWYLIGRKATNEEFQIFTMQRPSA